MNRLFISYAHADEALKNRLLVHLKALKREGLIDLWHDRMLSGGEKLDSSIKNELATANLVILLISADFINSEYCFEREMKQAFLRAHEGQCRVVPVIVKPCDWRTQPVQRRLKLGDIIALPTDGKPVTTWANPEEAWLDVNLGIRKILMKGDASQRFRWGMRNVKYWAHSS